MLNQNGGRVTKAIHQTLSIHANMADCSRSSSTVSVVTKSNAATCIMDLKCISTYLCVCVCACDVLASLSILYPLYIYYILLTYSNVSTCNTCISLLRMYVCMICFNVSEDTFSMLVF